MEAAKAGSVLNTTTDLLASNRRCDNGSIEFTKGGQQLITEDVVVVAVAVAICASAAGGFCVLLL